MTDPGTERGSSRRTWPIVAGLAAVIFGAGGYAVGAGLGSGDQAAPSDSGAGSATAEPSAAVSAPAEGGVIADDEAVGSTTDDGGAELAGAYDYYGGGVGSRNVFTGTGFSTGAGTATVYGFDAASVATGERAAELAVVFGVDGEPVLAEGTWHVGAPDHSAPNLSLSLDGYASFTYTNTEIDPWRECAGIWDDKANYTEEEAAAVQQEYAECLDSLAGGLPTQEEADQKLLEVLSTLGIDPAAVEISDEEPYGTQVSRMAQVQGTIEGTETSSYVALTLTKDGIYSVSGNLAQPVSLGQYPIVSEAEAFERLSDARFSALQTFWPILDGEEGGAVWEPPTQAPALPQAGSAVPWPVKTVELESAELTLMTVWTEDGSHLLVPAYRFTGSDGATFQVIALAQAALDFATG